MIFKLCILLVSAISLSSPLGDLAGRMKAGTWEELAQTNASSVLGQGMNAGNVLPYANALALDPIHKRIHVVAADHHMSGIDHNRHFIYEEAGNAWTELGVWPGSNEHAEDHIEVNPRTGEVFMKDR